MTKRGWKISALVLFGSLGVSYFGTAALVVSAAGASWMLSPQLPEERALLLTLEQRAIGGLLCAAMVVVLMSLPRARSLGVFLASTLASGAAVVLISDAVQTHAAAGVFAIALAVVALHFWAVFAFYMASSRSS